MLKKLESTSKHKSDDYVACEQIEKIFSIIFSEFRDRGISFLLADQRADHLHDSAIKLPALKFMMGLDSDSVERYSKNPQHIEVITHLPNRHCVFDNGATGEFYSFISMDYFPEKIESKYEQQEIKTPDTLNNNSSDEIPSLEGIMEKGVLTHENKPLNVQNSNTAFIQNIICPGCKEIIDFNNKSCPNCGLFLTIKPNFDDFK